MSTRLLELHVDPALVNLKARCAFCGETPWTGVWAGHQDVHVCRLCATDLLPRLMADAIWHPTLTMPEGEVALVQAEARFWRALYHNQQRHRAGE